MNFLVLGGGEAQKPAIVRAKEKGLRAIVIDPSSQAAGMQCADERYCHDLADVEFCTGVARDLSIGGVMTMSAQYPVPTLAAICESPGPKSTPDDYFSSTFSKSGKSRSKRELSL